jgi:hypothetical protein
MMRLAEAYMALLSVEGVDDVVLLNRNSILEEIEDNNASICEDVERFNSRAIRLQSVLGELSPEELKGELIRLRIDAMNISAEFDNFAAEVARYFRQLGVERGQE